MLRWLKIALSWAALPLVLIVLTFAVAINTPAFDKCLRQQEAKDSTEQFTENNPAPIVWVMPRVYCVGPVFEAYKDEISALSTLLIAAFTYTLWRSTSGLLRASNEQGTAIKTSAAQSTRAAGAMEGVATAVGISAETGKEIAARQKLVSEMQLRAYLSMIIGGGTFQDRPNNLKFSGQPLLVNNGQTPAFKIRYVKKAAILPAPLPDDFAWPSPDTESPGEDMIGPHQNRVLTAVVDGFVADNDVADIKVGRGQGLYVWGTVTYEDAFGAPHQTDFCHLLLWLPDCKDGKIWGIYIPNRNNTT